MSGRPPDRDESEADSLSALLTRKPTPRRRALRILSTVLVVAVVGVLLLQVLTSAGSPPATPTPNPLAHVQVVTRIGANITWGTITVAGKKLGGPPPQVVTLAEPAPNVARAVRPVQELHQAPEH